jgi:hypothetical protein
MPKIDPLMIMGWAVQPPKLFKFDHKRGYSRCNACDKWTHSNMIFRHEGRNWILCNFDYADYWENTDVLQSDYKGYNV